MSNLDQLKNILKEINIDEDVKLKIEKILNNYESELEEYKFLTTRNLRDQRVNENFIKKTVQLLEDSNESLRKSNKRLTKTNHKLLSSNEELERFAYVASHDLKTPLNNIVAFSKLIEKKLQPVNDYDLQKYLSFVISGGNRMKSLIEDILEYSGLSETSINSSKLFSLNKVIDDIEFSISEYIKDNNANLQILTPLPNFIGDRSKFFILFKNLIENGIKYNTSPSPNIKIYNEQSPNYIRICVEDDGIGIEEKFQARIFQMFTRLHRHSVYNGTGIGLAACKKIVDEFGGKIGVESQLNVKTIFKIDFPKEISHYETLD